MFRKILFPTDGSDFAQGTIAQAVAVAKQFNATLVAFHAMPRYRRPLHLDMTPFNFPSREEFAAQTKAQAQHALDAVHRAADLAGVSCSTRMAEDQPAAEAIVQAAKDEGCDLICMASHGESGYTPAFLGSNASKVLAHTTLPVLVLH